ncbi:mucin-7 precursor [Drepanopeziza brunnea f. sp. 'multigermtubi' MB_m1]|uniref:Mucin-7 n=1 Tax=Marssonina brunnea f. sp. multigermtubi (strain MB_m1) TaxID=1072389 RepID=K1WIQ6_MARBU|nr:mucin-7 precursor [Drepanopeziza brunnea f. sp. 'multigermtubi' MB_m1]EKD12696.1 mucin-7 precursor [Drepanopeziza brunnea f. sp. 'multigermtubi' MB_m1]
MSGGVRNLRAMFEQNKESSPPDRGRSPGESTGVASSTGTSPRPLSKVRTSFVAVERNGGQLGLKRDTSGDTNIHKRRTSFSVDEADNPQAAIDRKRSTATEMDARNSSDPIKKTAPEKATGEPNTKMTSSSNQAQDPVKTETVKMEKKPAASATPNGHTNGSKPATKPAEKVSTTKASSKPPPITTASSTTESKASPKKVKDPAPRIPKTPTSPSKSRPKEPPAKTLDQKPEKKAEKETSRAPTAQSRAPSRATKPASKPPTTVAHGTPVKTRIPPSPPQSGFVKPRPKSPTRPIKLPASLTAHTASSGSKTAAAGGPPPTRQSVSRASGNIQSTHSRQAHSVSSRAPSRASTTTSKAALTRKPSTVKSGSTRPSLGPPPSNQSLKRRSSRQSLPSSAPADEGFLARMMRPTTASASKTAEKPVTPPKTSQSAKRPVTRDGPMKQASALGSPVSQKSRRKEVSPTRRAKPVVKSPIKAKEQKLGSKEPVTINVAEKPSSQGKPEEKVLPVETPVVPAQSPVVEAAKPEVEESKPVESEGLQVEEVMHETAVPVAEDPVAEDPVAEDPVAEDPVAEDPVAEDPVAEEKAAVEDTPAPAQESSEPSVGREKATPTTDAQTPPTSVVGQPAASATSEAGPGTEEAPLVVEPASIPSPKVVAEQEKSEEAGLESPSKFETLGSSPEPKAPEKVEEMKPSKGEDPADIAARKEVSRMNAEFMKAAGLQK